MVLFWPSMLHNPSSSAFFGLSALLCFLHLIHEMDHLVFLAVFLSSVVHLFHVISRHGEDGHWHQDVGDILCFVLGLF
ncbi:hypothetical protein B0H19DRAFT_1113240 [Mycena capillaripes]|nr:hypothetical protein B0H19DRAFT_1113240 [Mycena capillaripes]